MVFFFFKQKTAYEMRISDRSSDVCSSDLSTDDAGDDFGDMLERVDVHDRRQSDDRVKCTMFEITIFGQCALLHEEDRHSTDEHRANAEADGDDEQVVRKCECTDHAVEREARVEDFEIKKGADACLRPEDHTSELQSLMRISHAVFRLKKNHQLIP